jgi:hypothetical protein
MHFRLRICGLTLDQPRPYVRPFSSPGNSRRNEIAVGRVFINPFVEKPDLFRPFPTKMGDPSLHLKNGCARIRTRLPVAFIFKWPTIQFPQAPSPENSASLIRTAENC